MWAAVHPGVDVEYLPQEHLASVLGATSEWRRERIDVERAGVVAWLVGAVAGRP